MHLYVQNLHILYLVYKSVQLACIVRHFQAGGLPQMRAKVMNGSADGSRLLHYIKHMKNKINNHKTIIRKE